MLVLHYHSPRSYHHSLPVFQTFWTGVNEGNDHAEYCSGLSHHRSVSFQLLCSALSPSKDPKEVTFAEKSGLCFIPLYSPARKPGIRTSNSSSVIFSRRDHSFSDTFWGGVWSSWWTITVGTYMYHPESDCVWKPTILPCEPVSPPDCGGESASPPCESVSSLESVHVYESTSLPRESVSPPKIPKRAKQTGNILQRSSVLSQLLTQQAPEVKCPQSKPKSSARILTSSENLTLLEEKERKKKEEAEEKQKRKEEREWKQMALEEVKHKKRLERERKQSEREEREERVRVRQGAGSSLKGMLVGRLRLWDDWCFTVCSQPQRCQSRLWSLEIYARRQQWVKLLWSSTLVRKLCNHAACSICNRGCCNYSLFGLEIDDSGHSKSSSPPPSEKVTTRGWSAAYLPKGMHPFII